MKQLNPRHDKCLNCGRDYVQKQWDIHRTKSALLLVQVEFKNPKHMLMNLLQKAMLTGFYNYPPPPTQQ